MMIMAEMSPRLLSRQLRATTTLLLTTTTLLPMTTTFITIKIILRERLLLFSTDYLMTTCLPSSLKTILIL